MSGLGNRGAWQDEVRVRVHWLVVAGMGVLSTLGCAAQEPESVGQKSGALITGGGSSIESASSSHLLLLIRIENGVFSVFQSTQVAGPIARRRAALGPSDWNFRALSSAGALLHSEQLGNPALLRAAFRNAATGQTEGVGVVSNEPLTFAVRVPAGSRTVQFFRRADATLAARGVQVAPIGEVTVPE